MKFFRSISLQEQQGFTLLELLIVIVIAGVLLSGITMTTAQIFSSNSKDTARMTAVQQVQSGVYWLSRDIQMAQNLQPGGGTGFPLQLRWVEWETNDVHTVSYRLDQGNFLRGYSVNGGAVEEAIIAHNINSDSDKTYCSLSGRVLTFSITSSVPYRSTTVDETRKLEVVARPGS